MEGAKARCRPGSARRWRGGCGARKQRSGASEWCSLLNRKLAMGETTHYTGGSQLREYVKFENHQFCLPEGPTIGKKFRLSTNSNCSRVRGPLSCHTGRSSKSSPCDGLDDCDSSKLTVQQEHQRRRGFRPTLEKLAHEHSAFPQQQECSQSLRGGEKGQCFHLRPNGSPMWRRSSNAGRYRIGNFGKLDALPAGGQ